MVSSLEAYTGKTLSDLQTFYKQANMYLATVADSIMESQLQQMTGCALYSLAWNETRTTGHLFRASFKN